MKIDLPTRAEWSRVLLAVAVVLASVGWWVTLTGCTRSIHVPSPPKGIGNAIVLAVSDFRILDVLAGLCAIGAVASILAACVPGLRVFLPPKLTIMFVLCAVGCWTVKLLLVKYLGLVAFLSIAGLVLGGAVFAYGHRNWIEKRTGVDLNRDGRVGDDPVPVASTVRPDTSPSRRGAGAGQQ